MKRTFRVLVSGVLAAAALMAAAVGGRARAEPVRVFAAGSLSAAIPELIAASGVAAETTFGPAGLLRQRSEAGERADLFASADMAQAQAVADKGLGLPATAYARNAMCLVTKGTLGLTVETMLDRLLDPNLRLATSTPVADPGGDYALAVFGRAEAMRPGAEAVLAGKALKLLGSPQTMAPVAGHSPAASIFVADRADAVLYYCSGAAAVLRDVPGLVALPMPDRLAVVPVYGLTVRADSPEAMRLALFILSPGGQAILAKHGLRPLMDDTR